MDVAAEALRVAGIRAGWAERTSGLGDAEKRLYRAILQDWADLGGPPDGWRIRAEAEALGLELEAALGALAERDLIIRDAGTGEITSAYPFSGAPTAHWVELVGGMTLYAMCALDALGIPFMLGRDAMVLSDDPYTGRPVRVEVQGGLTRWDPSEAVLFLGSQPGGGQRARRCCPYIHLFGSIESAEGYRYMLPDVEGYVLTQAEAVEAARRVFGDLLAGGNRIEGGGGEWSRRSY